MSAVKINRPRRVSLAGLMVALLLAAVATLGLHCTAGAVETATPMGMTDVDRHAGHRGGTASMAHRRVADQSARHGGNVAVGDGWGGRAAHAGGVAAAADGPGVGWAVHTSGVAAMAHHPIADPGIHPGSPAESGSRGHIALCVSVAVAVLLAMVRLGQPNAVEVRAPLGRLPAALRRLAWPSPDPVRLCVLRT